MVHLALTLLPVTTAYAVNANNPAVTTKGIHVAASSLTRVPVAPMGLPLAGRGGPLGSSCGREAKADQVPRCVSQACTRSF